MKHGEAFRLELVDQPPAPQRDVTVDDDQPRYVAPDSHRPHGTRAKYVVEKCRCWPCTLDNRRCANERRRAMARPDQAWVPYVPAGRARDHIRDLARHGIGLKTVAKVSGVSHGTLWKLMYGDTKRFGRPSKRIRPETEAKILAVGYEHAADGARIPAGPTWRLLDDLIARGWTKGWIAQRLGAKTPALQIKRDLVRASTARAVKALHDSLDGQTGPGKRSRWDDR